MDRRGLILLDRDGVLNRMVIDPEQGTIDSPLHPDQVEIYPWVPEALARLAALGFGLVVVSNQPAAAKGKTTRANLEATHARVMEQAGTRAGQILTSHLCFHRAEDVCDCRKPKTGLLEEAFAAHPRFERALSWMAGDGVTDVQAGMAAGLNTAFFGPQKCDHCKIMDGMGLRPRFWGENLLALAEFLERSKGEENKG